MSAVAVGAEIRRRREAQKLRAVDLAARAKVHQTYLSRVEGGKVDVSLTVLTKIAAALGCNVGELFGPLPRLSRKSIEAGRLFDRADPGVQEGILGIIRAVTRKKGRP